MRSRNLGSLSRRSLAGVFLLLSLRPAAAQQIFINSVWVANAGNCTGPILTPGSFGQYWCDGPGGDFPTGHCPQGGFGGNISNNPHIEFDQFLPSLPSIHPCSGLPSPPIPPGSTALNICNSRVFLCTNIGFSNRQSGNSAFALDKVEFQLFKFGPGANPFDPGSTPPLRTFSIDAPGNVPAGQNGTIPIDAQCTSESRSLGCGYCVMWDGNINILGELGKSNGNYGFRAKVETNQTGASGNINISQERAYPSGTTLDSTCDPSGLGNLPGTVSQMPIVMDVTNIHVVRTTPTIVGAITGVAAEPYNITYRISKDATMYMTIDTTGGGPGAGEFAPPVTVRRVVNGLPRVGEGTPDGTLQNGDAWNGRHDNGDLMPPGVFLATLQALASDQYGFDLSGATTRQISLDPLQITDILVQPLTSQSTTLAVLTYTLTEPATVYVDIFPPGTQFCQVGPFVNPLQSVNAPDLDQTETGLLSPKNFNARVAGCAGPAASLIRRITEQKDFRRPVISFWDGRDSTGNVVPDGDYVFVLYAALPSQNGFQHCGTAPIPPTCTGLPQDKRIWTSVAKSGYFTVARGMVTISQIAPATSVIGSTPAVAGLNPFIFSYSLSREALVSVKILNAGGTLLKKTLVDREVRPGNFLNREIWSEGVGDDGLILSSGNYLVELTAADPFFPVKVTTTTALFPLNLFRLVDVAATPLLTGATDIITLNYQLSQSMQVAWNIYPPGTIVTGSTATWPPCGILIPNVCAQTPVNGQPGRPLLTVQGMRPGRLRITEFWDGRDQNGLFVPDGTYIYTLVAQSTTTPRFFATDKVVGQLTVARGSIVFPIFNVKPTIPQLFNSSQTITLPPFELEYSLTRQSSVTIRILDTRIPPQIVRTLISGQIRDGNIINEDFWDARDDRGNFVQPGFYTVQAIAEDLASVLSSGSTVQQTIAVDPLRIYDVAVSPLVADNPSALISYQVSESMKVSTKIYKPGTTFDPSGNPGPPEKISLVKRIVGFRPARTEINEIWDGTDEKQALVPDGNYIFRIVASTDSSAIDTLTGNVRPGASLAEDLIVAEVPVVRGESLDPANDFVNNTFMYPNPLPGTQATFNIFVPFQSDVFMKIYNIAGELVFEQEFRNQARSSDDGPIVFIWNRVNSANRKLAPGVYFVLIREEETLGGANTLQTVKKIMLQ